MITHNCIGKNIKSLRKKDGLTQTELANFLGVTFQQIQKYEKGENRLPIEHLHKLKKLFDVPYDIFFEENNGAHIHSKQDEFLIRSIRDRLQKIYAIKNKENRTKAMQILEILCTYP